MKEAPPRLAWWGSRYQNYLLGKLEFVYLIAAAPKAPLCKGSCQPNRLTEGLLPQYDFAEAPQ